MFSFSSKKQRAGQFTPILRQENNRILMRGASREALEKANAAPEKLKDLIKYGLLYQDEAGKWLIATKDHDATTPNGSYAFVRTKTGFLRVWPIKDGATMHLLLSGYADSVRYAGEIAFSAKGTMLSWNNQSGGYLPPEELQAQAGLPRELYEQKCYSPTTTSPSSSNKSVEALDAAPLSAAIAEKTLLMPTPYSSQLKKTFEALPPLANTGIITSFARCDAANTPSLKLSPLTSPLKPQRMPFKGKRTAALRHSPLLPPNGAHTPIGSATWQDSNRNAAMYTTVLAPLLLADYCKATKVFSLEHVCRDFDY